MDEGEEGLQEAVKDEVEEGEIVDEGEVLEEDWRPTQTRQATSFALVLLTDWIGNRWCAIHIQALFNSAHWKTSRQRW